MTVADWIGTIGVGLLLIAFGLNLLDFISAKSFTYLIINLSGALLAGVASVLINYIPFVILELVWVLVSVFAIGFKIKESRKIKQ